jgi:hypothetical protein
MLIALAAFAAFVALPVNFHNIHIHNPKGDPMPDYSRFHVIKKNGLYSLLDQESGWVWADIQEYSSVLAMMQHILDKELTFHDDEYKRIRRLEGPDWEAELSSSTG